MGTAATRNRLTSVILLLGLVAATLVMIVGTAAPVQGAAFTVTRFDDPAPNACLATDCSLREAIIAANTNGLDDVITLVPGSYVLAFKPVPGEDDLGIFGDLDIASNITINGAGAATTTITSTAAVGERVFHVVAGGTAAINGVTVSGGMSATGAGIQNDAGAMTTLNDVVVTGNTTSAAGGSGIYSLGTLILNRSTISGNGASAGGAGGGLLLGASGSSTLTNVSVSGNNASVGGGILLAGTATFIGNGVTVTANTADIGGGLAGFFFSGTATIGGSILAGNIDSDLATTLDPDCFGPLASTGYLILGNNAGCTLTGGVGDQVGTPAAPIDPLLGPLAANGSSGPFTHALLAGSPALNAVPPATCVIQLGASPTDARKVARPQGTNCDIGAYEAQLPTEAADTYSVPALGTLTVPAPGVLGNDTNPEAGSLTATKVTDPGNGTLTLDSDGSFTYKPKGSFTGTDSFTYRASNIAGSVNTQTVTITVTPAPLGTLVGHDVGLVDPVSGMWHLRKASSGAITSFTYGVPGDIPFMGDWDCNGTETPGLYRQSDGFAYIRNSNTFGVADRTFFMGNPSDIPLAGDFNGDGCDTVSIYRPSEQRIYIANTLGPNNGAISADFSYIFGNPGDKPFVGDFNGNGSETIGLHRESTGFVYFRNTHTIGNADVDYFFGDPGDRLVAGDWGVVDGVFTPAVFRPPQETFFFRHTNTQGNADSQFVWPQSGASSWRPVSGVMGL